MIVLKNFNAFIAKLSSDSNVVILGSDNFQILIEMKDDKILSIYSSVDLNGGMTTSAAFISVINKVLESEKERINVNKLKEEVKILSDFIKSTEAEYIEACINQSIPIEIFDAYITSKISDRFTELEYKNGKPRFRLKGTRFIYCDKFDAIKDLDHINRLIETHS